MTIITMIIMVVASFSSTMADHGVVIATGAVHILDGVVAHGVDQEAPGEVTQEEDLGEEDLEAALVVAVEAAMEAAMEATEVVAVVDVEDAEADSDILYAILHSQQCAI